MLKINKQITSQRATHVNGRTDDLVKVLTSTKAFDFNNNLKTYTAEIMTGPDAGKYTTVYAKDLTKIYWDTCIVCQCAMKPDQVSQDDKTVCIDCQSEGE